jgi:hypothetical protein
MEGLERRSGGGEDDVKVRKKKGLMIFYHPSKA